MKKILLGLGSVAAITIPVVTVVACGTDEKKVQTPTEEQKQALTDKEIIEALGNVSGQQILDFLKNNSPETKEKIRHDLNEKLRHDALVEQQNKHMSKATHEAIKEIETLKIVINYLEKLGYPANADQEKKKKLIT